MTAVPELAGERVWRFFYGLEPVGDGEGWAHHDVAGLLWEEARERALAVLDGFEHGGCGDCRAAVNVARSQLKAAVPGSVVREVVDGEDLLVLLDEERVAGRG